MPFSLNHLVGIAVALASCFLGKQIAGQWLFCVVLGDYFCALPHMLKLERIPQIRLFTLSYLNHNLNKSVSKVACSVSYTLCYSFLLVLPVDFLSLKFYYLLFDFFWNSSLFRLQLKLGRLPPGNLTVNYHIPLCLVGDWFCLVVLFFLFQTRNAMYIVTSTVDALMQPDSRLFL